VRAPGPGHSAEDRSLCVKLDDKAPDGFLVHSYAGDDDIKAKDYVRQKISPPEWKPKEKKTGKGTGTPWSPITDRYVYRQADGTPYLQVCRTAAKGFFQNHWNGQTWVPYAPSGPKVPFRLPELLAAGAVTPIFITEGEKDALALAKLGFVATTNSGGADNGKGRSWTPDLNQYFKDRHVHILADNDSPGHAHAEHVARNLDGIAASVRVVKLPGLEPKGDVSDWLKDDPTGARLVRKCKAAPLWEPSTSAPDKTADADEEDADDLLVRKKQADILIELASSAELFHDRDDVGYARFDVNGHKENWPIRSKGFKRWLARGFYESTQSAPNSDAMQAATGVLEARAQFDAPEHNVHVRVAGHDGRIYIDLADKEWRAIEIDDDGWRIVDSLADVYFRRSSGMKPLPEPVKGGSIENDLKPLLNIKNDNEFVLAVAWLLTTLRDWGPYPVLALSGEQGSAKSWFLRILRALIDPNSVPLRSLPRNERDVFIAASNGYVLGFDNVSGLPDWLSDTFCRLSTGGGFSTRQLFTDGDEVLFGLTRPIVLNGIEDTVTRPDLADRSIVLTLAPIADHQRKLETKLWAEFELKRPRILGALLTAVSHGLRVLPDVELDCLPRMADAAMWIVACEGALWPKGTFMAAYTNNVTEATETVLADEPVAIALRKYMKETSSFEGTATDLLKALNTVVTETHQKEKVWPKRANVLSGILRRFAPALRKVGIDISSSRTTDERKIAITTRPVKLREASSSPASLSFANDANNLDGSADRHALVMDRAGTVIGNGQDDPHDDHDADIVMPNRLRHQKNDDHDDHGAVCPNTTGSCACVQCRGAPDGTELRHEITGRTVWLHRECARFYRKDQP
jgi:hypothetical protein